MPSALRIAVVMVTPKSVFMMHFIEAVTGSEPTMFDMYMGIVFVKPKVEIDNIVQPVVISNALATKGSGNA